MSSTILVLNQTYTGFDRALAAFGSFVLFKGTNERWCSAKAASNTFTEKYPVSS